MRTKNPENWEFLDKAARRLEIPDCVPRKVDVAIGVNFDIARDGKSVNAQSDAIVRKSVELYKSGIVDNLIFTGGYSAGGLLDGELMAEHAKTLDSSLDYGTNLFLEPMAKRTWENALFTLPIMEDHKWKSAILVAQQLHARRTKATFNKVWGENGKYSKEVYVAKARSSYDGNNSLWRLENPLFFAAWDSIAFVYSKVKGYA